MNKDFSIPTNHAVLEKYKNKKTIKFTSTKINAIRNELYKENILVKPKKGSRKTYFTDYYLGIKNLKDKSQ